MINNFFDKSKKFAEQLVGDYEKHVNPVVEDAFSLAKEYCSQGIDSALKTTEDLYYGLMVSDNDFIEVEQRIENQGGYYRELTRQNKAEDVVMLSGESLATLISTNTVSEDIINAYQAAYPNLAENISFQDKAASLEGEALEGFISGIKGKLFEQQYVEYLNQGNLPDGYVAVLASSPTQPGWDIAIKGENGEIASLLQAKATDSVSYVKEALDKYPNIDVVTTEEVYSHLVMTGISENIADSGIAHTSLLDAINDGIAATDVTMDFMPPIFTMAFIAFSSYKDEGLAFYEKARDAGDRTGRTYILYLIGNGVAALSNVWWLGALSTIGSSFISDNGSRKYGFYKKMKEIEQNNQNVIKRLSLKNE